MDSRDHERFRRVGTTVLAALALTCALAPTACKTPEGETGEQQRATIRKSNQAILEKVYAAYDGAKSQVGDSVGTQPSAASMRRFFWVEPGTATGF
jgi:hypothetical protein